MLPPVLPPASSWFPGHMSHFTRLLPSFLTRTDIVIELRDARLPLTSINPVLEDTINKWQVERRRMGAGAAGSNLLCERIIVFAKSDLVGQWGLQPFIKAMKKLYPDQYIHFTKKSQPQTIKDLSKLLISMAASRPTGTAPETNVLVVGMPNVGKSTLLNTLRNQGIPGPTPKALRTGAHPGLTQALSTRLKLCLDPLIYSFDSPGVMVPFMGYGDRGAERGLKLALIAGIKEGMYDIEALTSYLLYRLYVLNPHWPTYMNLLPHGTPFPLSALEFLDTLATRLGMIKRGGQLDSKRAALWFVKWWRDTGSKEQDYEAIWNENQHPGAPSDRELQDAGISKRMGWGFDFEWDFTPSNAKMNQTDLQAKMEECILAHKEALREERKSISPTQEKKKERDEKIAKRIARRRAKAKR